MEMTEEEIIKKYKNNPQAKTINILADLNGCQAYEIKRILGKAGVYIPKAGRPKKDKADETIEKIDEIEQSQNSKRSDEPLNDTILQLKMRCVTGWKAFVMNLVRILKPTGIIPRGNTPKILPCAT